MCGIVGVLSQGQVDGALLRRMRDALRHRGPDDAGIYVSGNVGLAHRRLSIIDLSDAAHQPMSDAQGQVWIVYNGEIYNFRDLRTELEYRGHIFRSTSDTEVVLHAYLEWGSAAVRRFRGMFAFAIWDKRMQQLLLARDPLGIKPLYLTDCDGDLVFASEIKGILAYPKLSRTLNPSAVAQYLRYLYVPEPLSIFENIHRLPAGHVLIQQGKERRLERYYSFPEPDTDEDRGFAFYAERLYELLRESVHLHMVADVPVGAFLSGGVDSSSVVALMREVSNGDIHTFTIGFDARFGSYDERPYARLVAEHVGSIHHEVLVTPDIAELLKEVVCTFDEPFANPAALIAYALSEFTSRYVKVALAGVGGDELFGGYPRYAAIQWLQAYAKVPAPVRRIFGQAIQRLPSPPDRRHPFGRLKRFVSTANLSEPAQYDALMSYLPEDTLRSLLHPDIATQATFYDAIRRDLMTGSNPDRSAKAMMVDLYTYLPGDLLCYSDRCSMRHSLEVRVPFCDIRLLEFALKVPTKYKLHRQHLKYILKERMARCLPREVLFRPKRGFSVPIVEWLRGELRPWVQRYLEADRLAGYGVFNPLAVKRAIAAHQDGDDGQAFLLWALIVFDVWATEAGIV